MNSSWLASLPKDIRKRNERSDSVRSMGVRKHYGVYLCGPTTYRAGDVGADEFEITHRASNGADLCNIVDMDFREFTFSTH
jgi:hypothetical protein